MTPEAGAGGQEKSTAMTRPFSAGRAFPMELWVTTGQTEIGEFRPALIRPSIVLRCPRFTRLPLQDDSWPFAALEVKSSIRLSWLCRLGCFRNGSTVTLKTCRECLIITFFWAKNIFGKVSQRLLTPREFYLANLTQRSIASESIDDCIIFRIPQLANMERWACRTLQIVLVRVAILLLLLTEVVFSLQSEKTQGPAGSHRKRCCHQSPRPGQNACFVRRRPRGCHRTGPSLLQ